MSDERTIDMGNTWSAFADRLVWIERHGVVSHLVFATAQILDDGREPHAIVCARVIVPTEMLASMGLQMTAPARKIGGPTAGARTVFVLVWVFPDTALSFLRVRCAPLGCGEEGCANPVYLLGLRARPAPP